MTTRNDIVKYACLGLAAMLLAHCGAAMETAEAPAVEFEGDWTDTNFPPYIERITHFGQRADWSHDGKRILFLEKTYGDAYEIDLETREIRAITGHYHHNGYTRVLYLSNGDFILSGSRTFDPENIRPARHETAELGVLSKDLDKPPVALGEFCSEGPAISRTQLKIAWAADHANYPDTMPEGLSQMYVAEIDYSSGEPKIANKKVVADSRKVDFEFNQFETQNFVPPDETKIVFSAYGFQGTDVMMLDTETGEIANMSNTPVQYDEPEGVFPDGKHTLVECDRQHKGKGSTHIDIWKLALDGSGDYERITYFNEAGIYKGTNPVISDDGRYMAFQVPKVQQIAGVGQGIYIMDLEAAGLR